MQIGYLLGTDIFILLLTLASMVYYFIEQKKHIDISGIFKFAITVLIIITVLDAFFSGHFFFMGNSFIYVSLILLYLILHAFLPYAFFLTVLETTKKKAFLKNIKFVIITAAPAVIYSILVLITPLLSIMINLQILPDSISVTFSPLFTVVFYFVYLFYLSLITYFCVRNLATISGEFVILYVSYTMFMLITLITNSNPDTPVSYHVVSSVFLFLYYFALYSKNMYRNSQTLNDYNRSNFINVVNNHLYNKDHFIIIAVSIDQFPSLIDKYGKKETTLLLRNIKEFLAKIFPSNDIFHYDNLDFIFVFDNTHSIRSTGPIIDEILSVFNMPWNIGNGREKMTVTISSLLCPEDSDNLTEIIDVLRNSIEDAQKEGTSSIVYGKEHIYNREKALSNLTLENKQLEIAAREAMSNRSALEMADKKNDVFLTNISHKVRTPLNSVMGLSELLLKEDLPPTARNKANDIKYASTSLFNVFNDLLDYFNIDSGRLEIIKAPYDVNEIIHEALNVISTQAKEQNIKLTLTIDDTIPSKLIGDAQRIRQVIITLLRNALRSTSEGEIKLQISYETSANNYVELYVSVSDTGVGIKPEDLDNIFDTLQTFDSRRTKMADNCSLNLTVCKRIITLMGGEITAESNYGEGSTFNFHLPQKISNFMSLADAKENTSYKTKQFVETFTAEGAKVLVVDDNRLNREITKGLLQPYKIEVTTANSGKDCLELLKTNVYDLIFMDHLMPDMDGIDTKNHIREMSGSNYQTVPIVILTANVSNNNRSTFLQQGFADYIPKPIDIALLDSVLKKQLPSDYIVEKGITSSNPEKPFGGKLPKVSGMNEKEAMSHFNSLDELLAELYKFSQNAPNILAELKKSLVTNNISFYLMYLTNLTESADKFGMNKLVKLGNANEKAAQADNLDFLKKNLPFLIQAYKKFLDELK